MISPKSRIAKGRNGEHEDAAFFRRWFPKVERRAKRRKDAGDLAGTPFTVQTKRWKADRIDEWMDALETQVENNDGDPGVLSTRKPRRKRVWHMTDETFRFLLDAIWGGRE